MRGFKTASKDYSLMVHGGAGALDHITTDRAHVRYMESVRVVLEHGRTILSRGGSALETAETCASLLEDDPLFNAGCGSVLNEGGKVEMDAAIMDGQDLSAGAVAAVHNVANPILLARLVLARSEHVMLIGEGAMRFADHCGLPQVADHYFLTEERVKQYDEAHRRGDIMLDHDAVVGHLDEDQKYGTIGAVACDTSGNLAAATSTGGIVNKRMGRVGDSPIIGAGVYADNETCAVSATGYGEDFMRTVLSKTVADYIEHTHCNAGQAAQAGIDYLLRKVRGRGGIIVIDRQGLCASRYTTKKMIHGWIEKGGETFCTFSGNK
jgi:beta-aspartyl-peptidase (threonine type)